MQSLMDKKDSISSLLSISMAAGISMEVLQVKLSRCDGRATTLKAPASRSGDRHDLKSCLDGVTKLRRAHQCGFELRSIIFDGGIVFQWSQLSICCHLRSTAGVVE